MGEECGFPFIALFDSDVIVSPVDVHNCEFGASTEMIDDLGNGGGYVPIFLCPLVYGSVVLYWL